MTFTTRGVPQFGTLLFLFLAVLLSAGASPSRGATPAPAAATMTAQGEAPFPATLFADTIDYAEDQGSIHAQGNVKLWYSNVTLTADTADADLNEQKVRANGHVSLTEAGRTIQSAQLEYDLKTRSASARGILFATYPWYYQGESVEKIGDQKVVISKPSFTTCNKCHPHYHITAERIDIELGESLTAYNAVFYVGSTPVFYLPWITRSIKDSRPPFSIRVGRNDFEGWFAYLKYNYFFQDRNYGSLALNLMEKKGLGFGLDHHLRYDWLGAGSDDFSFFYVRDPELGRERWTGSVDSRHELSPEDLFQAHWDYLSDNAFNRDFSTSLVDTFQQKSYLSYSRRGSWYFLGFNAQDVNTYDPLAKSYFTSLRELPSVNFNINSLKLLSWRYPLYFSLTSSARRWFSRGSVSEDAFYRDEFALTPTFTETYAFPLWVRTQPSISASLSLPSTASYDEHTLAKGVTSEYATSLSLTNKWVYYQRTNPTHLLQSRLSHTFRRKLPLAGSENAAYAGVSGNQFDMALDYYMGNFLTLQAQTGYNLLPLPGFVEDIDRLTDLNFNGRLSLGKVNLYGQGMYDWQTRKITNGTLSASAAGSNWNTSLTTSYSIRSEGVTPPYALSGTLSAGWNPGWGLAFSGSMQFDVVGKKLDRVTLGVNHDLHCWMLQAAVTQYADGKTDVGLGINLKAFPQFKAGLGGVGVDVGGE